MFAWGFGERTRSTNPREQGRAAPRVQRKKKKVGVEASLQWEGQAAGEEVGAGLSGASHPWAWRGDWARGNRLRHHHHREPPPPPHIPRAATNSQVGAGLRGPLGAGRQGAAQRPAQPDVVGACRSLGSVPGLWRPGRRCWEEGHLEFTPLKLV